MEKFTPLATNFTLPPGLTGWTNFTSASGVVVQKERLAKIFWGTEVEFVHAVSAGGSVKFLPAV